MTRCGFSIPDIPSPNPKRFADAKEISILDTSRTVVDFVFGFRKYAIEADTTAGNRYGSTFSVNGPLLSIKGTKLLTGILYCLVE
jgi:hypothetical protein